MATSTTSGNDAPALQALSASLRGYWAAMATRERRLTVAAVVVVALYLLWALALQPALRTLSQTPKLIDAAEAQLQGMQRLAAEARELRSAPPVAPGQAQAAVKAAAERLGERARVVIQGDRAVVTVNGLSGDQLGAWMAEVRSGARARPVEANLTRADQGYSGTVVLSLGGTP